MAQASDIQLDEVVAPQQPAIPSGKEKDDPFGLARAADSFRHGFVDSTRIREQEKTLREENLHQQKMLELDHAEAERKRTFRSNWIIAVGFCLFQALIAAYGFKANNISYILAAANGVGAFFVSRKF
jgi:Flp pilus assembly protein TadB